MNRKSYMSKNEDAKKFCESLEMGDNLSHPSGYPDMDIHYGHEDEVKFSTVDKHVNYMGYQEFFSKFGNWVKR